MIKEIKGNDIIIGCNNCSLENHFDVSQRKSSFREDFDEYENISFECPGCQTVEIYNMNIPIDDIDEPFETGDLPVDEEIQRAYVRILMRIIREDLKK